MSRDIALGGGIFASVWGVVEFGVLHSPELLGVVGPLMRLSQRFDWLPTDPIQKAWLAVMVIVFLVGLWRFARSAIERFRT